MIFERLRCAAMQLVHGLTAPIIYPVVGAYGGARLMTGSNLGRSMLVIDDFVIAACVMAIGFFGGVVAGVATTFETVMIESHYQLWRPDEPQEQPWIHRKLSDPKLYQNSADKVLDYIYG